MFSRLSVDRREFLKVSRLFLLSTLLPQRFLEPDKQRDGKNSPNFLILVFDALSAMDMSLYGYPRQTTPNIDRIAERAIVYHDHYAGGHWTYPGTASLLTGVLPWTHRGLWVEDPIISPHNAQNIFGLFRGHHRLAYTHNPAAELLLVQFKTLMQGYQERASFLLNEISLLDGHIFKAFLPRDHDSASVSWTRYMTKVDDGYANSLFLSSILEHLTPKTAVKYEDIFPNGLPRFGPTDYFLLEDAIDGIISTLSQAPTPYLAYYHLLPPHAPYESTRIEFVNRFKNDDYRPVSKAAHFLSDGIDQATLNAARERYDEYILYVDAEFGRLIDTMEADGSLENTWVILTSDHGEMFERGIPDHRHPVFYQAVARVPLMILQPGQTMRQDIYAPTSAVDLLPTLLYLDDQAIPNLLEGGILPPFSAQNRDRGHSIFALDARKNHPQESLSRSTIMLARDNYKLTYYIGYDELPGGKPFFELYDLAEDPEELRNIYEDDAPRAKQMREELLEKLEEKNRPYL